MSLSCAMVELCSLNLGSDFLWRQRELQSRFKLGHPLGLGTWLGCNGPAGVENRAVPDNFNLWRMAALHNVAHRMTTCFAQRV